MSEIRYPERSPLEITRALARTAIVAMETQRRYAERKLRRALAEHIGLRGVRARALVLAVLEPSDPPDPEWTEIYDAVSREIPVDPR